MMQMVVVVIVLGNGCGIAAPAWLTLLVSRAEESAPSYLTCGVNRVWHTRWGWSTAVCCMGVHLPTALLNHGFAKLDLSFAMLTICLVL